MNTIIKCFRKLQGAAIKTLSYFNVKKYMKHYIKHLQLLGVNIPDYNGLTYIAPDAKLDGSNYHLLNLGQGITISSGVRMLVHDYSVSRGIRIATNEFDSKIRFRIMKPITIKDGAFIGADTILLPGSLIGQNTVIGAGSVVHGEIPDNVVAAGNPAKVISALEDFGRKHLEKQDYETYYSK